MEAALEAAILGNANDEDIEYIMLENVLVNRDNIPPSTIFDINELTEEEIISNFRFDRRHIASLVQALGIVDVVTDTSHRVNGITALCILLRRLVYPNRLIDIDISSMFHLSPQSLSQIIAKTVEVILGNYEAKLTNLNNLQWLNRDVLQLYSEAVVEKGGAVKNCWGFVDGTARQICRPVVEQQEYYSGHKRFHCVKYQSVLTPDGIIVSLKGAYPGRRHDAGIFRDSLLYRELEDKAMFGNNFYVLYGDQAYGVRQLLLGPFGGRNILPHQEHFNQTMKILRVAVEWGFQKVISIFAFTDFSKIQKLLLQDVEGLYKVSVLLTNCHTCLYGSQTATYFNVVPPTLEEYLRD